VIAGQQCRRRIEGQEIRIVDLRICCQDENSGSRRGDNYEKETLRDGARSDCGRIGYSVQDRLASAAG
jgi:hypothetical protein